MYYLDHCGSTPISPEVQSAIREFLTSGTFGNPSAVHHVAGRKASQLVENSRELIANAFCARHSEVIFTSGATEANNLLLWGFALRYRQNGCHIIFGATEHKSIFDTCIALSELPGVTVSKAPVNRLGITDLSALEELLLSSRDKPTLVAIMHTNNEIPARHPVERISELCHSHGAFFHCDGVQGYVREKVNFNSESFGSYVISTHKIYGPKGLGILLLGDGPLSPRLTPAYRGGNHENNMRPGTLNTLAIAAGAKAITCHETKRLARIEHMRECARIFTETLSGLKGFQLTVPLNKDAAGIVNFYIDGLDAPSLLANIPNICINRGASCTGSGGETFSHVPSALNLPVEIGANVLRASFGDGITVGETHEAANALIKVISKINSRN